MDMQNVNSLVSAQNSPCPVCKGQQFEWGRLGRQVYYVPGDDFWVMRGFQYIRVRRCLNCNHLLSFADQELTRKQRQTVLPIIVIAVLLAALAAFLPLITAIHR